ncbi:MAG TPA: glycosyltransferase family 39 protein [Solirubrobacterales bacterium]|nr:glycosyltransferase family 39 protein [Solirubrobacterales bacterium]
MKSLAARNGGRAGLAALVVIVLLGAGLRLDYAWDGRAPVYDAVAYNRIAENLEQGRGFTLGGTATQPASNYSPGLPLLAGALYEVSGGAHERFVRIVLALIGALAALFTYLIGRRLFNPLAGLIGAAVVAVFPALLEYQGMLMSEPLAATLLSAAILAILWASDMRPVAAAQAPDPALRWLLPGALLGALALARPEYLGVAVLLVALVAAWQWPDWRRSLGQAALLLLGIALVVGPWTARNAIVLDRVVPISTGGGQVLFAGAYIPSKGDPERVGEEVLERHPGLTKRLAAENGISPPRPASVVERVRLEQILTALAAQRYPDLEADRALARMGRERLWHDVSGEPTAYLGFLAHKIARLWSPGPRKVMERLPWPLLHWVTVLFALLGLIVLFRGGRQQEALLLATVLVAITAVSALLVASPRRVLVMMPLLAALAGVGAAWLLARSRGPEGRAARQRG